MQHKLALHLAALIFGSQHVVTKMALSHIPHAILFSTIRFSVSSIFSIIFFCVYKIYIETRDEENRELLYDTFKIKKSICLKGLELGFYLFGGFCLQTIGLKYTTASRSAYLLYLNVKFVPIFNYCFYKTVYSSSTWISVMLAISGTLLLSLDKDSSGGEINIGDVFSLFSAVSSSLFIIRAENDLCMHDLIQLNMFTLTSVSVYFLITCLITQELYSFNIFSFWLSLTYLAIIVTCVGQCLQFYGQRKISSAKSALIFALDPVYNVFFSFFLLNESFTKQGMIGIIMILFGVYITSDDDI